MPWYNPISIIVELSRELRKKTLSEKLQKLQNHAARIFTSSSSSYDADAGYLLQQLGWKDLIAQHQIQVALVVFKALNDLVPHYLSSMFTERSMPGFVLRWLTTVFVLCEL